VSTIAQTQAALQLTAPEPKTLKPAELLQLAVAQGANVEQLTKLMDLQERWERREAKRAYDAAMKAFKAEPPRITKNSRVYFEPKDKSKAITDYYHATLDHVCDAIVGALSRVGISHRWKVEQNGEWIKVTCVLTHELGHAEETSLQGCADLTGNKNSIQAVGSTVTYLQRYTLLAATGLATSDQDDDDGGTPNHSQGNNSSSTGSQTQGNTLGDEEYVALLDNIEGAGTVEELKKLYVAALAEAEKAGDESAKGQFNKAKNQRYRELANAR
jgi:ERF superfamily